MVNSRSIHDQMGDSTIEWSRMLRSRSTFSSGAANHEQPGRVQLTIELVPVQVFCSRITLAAALMGTFELLVQSFSASSAFSRGASCVASIFAVIVCIHAVSILILSIATPASSFVLARRGGSWRLDGWRLHLRGYHGLETFSKIRRVPCVHGKNLRRHRSCKLCNVVEGKGPG